jgi:hypothetical protein
MVSVFSLESSLFGEEGIGGIGRGDLLTGGLGCTGSVLFLPGGTSLLGEFCDEGDELVGPDRVFPLVISFLGLSSLDDSWEFSCWEGCDL